MDKKNIFNDTKIYQVYQVNIILYVTSFGITNKKTSKKMIEFSINFFSTKFAYR